MQRSDDHPRPPTWALALLERTIQSDEVRHAILGDLYEEFIGDVRQAGATSARLRCARRSMGIAAYAAFDRLTCRSWVGGDAGAPPLGDAAPPVPPVSAVAPVATMSGALATRGVAGYAVITFIAFIILLVGIVGNTMLFTATVPHSARVSSAAGVGGVVLFVACAGLAAFIVCAGPRLWRRPLRGT